MLNVGPLALSGYLRNQSSLCLQVSRGEVIYVGLGGIAFAGCIELYGWERGGVAGVDVGDVIGVIFIVVVHDQAEFLAEVRVIGFGASGGL